MDACTPQERAEIDKLKERVRVLYSIFKSEFKRDRFFGMKHKFYKRLEDLTQDLMAFNNAHTNELKEDAKSYIRRSVCKTPLHLPIKAVLGTSTDALFVLYDYFNVKMQKEHLLYGCCSKEWEFVYRFTEKFCNTKEENTMLADIISRCVQYDNNTWLTQTRLDYLRENWGTPSIYSEQWLKLLSRVKLSQKGVIKQLPIGAEQWIIENNGGDPHNSDDDSSQTDSEGEYISVQYNRPMFVTRAEMDEIEKFEKLGYKFVGFCSNK